MSHSLLPPDARRPVVARLYAASAAARLLVFLSLFAVAAAPAQDRNARPPKPTKTIDVGPQAQCLGIREDGVTLALVNLRTLQLFDPQGNGEAKQVELECGDAEIKLLSPDAKLAAVLPRGGGRVEVWNVDTRKQECTSHGAEAAVAFAAGGKLLLTEPTTVVDTTIGNVVFQAPLQKPAISADGRLLAGWRAIGQGAYELLLVDVATGNSHSTLYTSGPGFEGSYGQLAFSGDAKRLAWLRPAEIRVVVPGRGEGSQQGVEVAIWNTDNGQVEATLRDSAPEATFGFDQLVATSDGRHLFAVASNTLYRWNLEKGGMLAPVRPQDTGINLFAILPDGQTAVSVSNWATGVRLGLSNEGGKRVLQTLVDERNIDAGGVLSLWKLESLVDAPARSMKQRAKSAPRKPAAGANAPAAETTNEKRAAAWLRLAQKHHDEGRDEQARKYAQKVIDLLPDSPLAGDAKELLEELE